MLKNVKAAASKARSFVLMGGKSLFWDRMYIHRKPVVTTHVYPGVRTPCVSVFSCEFLQHQPPPSAQAFTGFSWIWFLTEFALIVFILCLLFVALFPPLSCVWGLVQGSDVAFRAQLSTVSVANDSLSKNGLNLHHRTVPSISGTSVALTLLVSGNTSEMLLLDVECLYL